MSNDFDDYVANLGRKADEDFKTRELGLEKAESDRQAFLSNFRDTADRIIIPVFERAAQRSTPALSLKLQLSPAKDRVELSVAMKIDPNQTMSGSIRYEANLDSRLIIRIDRYPSGKETVVRLHPADLNEEEVENRIKFFLANFRMP